MGNQKQRWQLNLRLTEEESERLEEVYLRARQRQHYVDKTEVAKELLGFLPMKATNESDRYYLRGEQPPVYVPSTTMLCEDENHRELQSKLDAVLHSDVAILSGDEVILVRQGIKINVESHHEKVLSRVPPPDTTTPSDDLYSPGLAERQSAALALRSPKVRKSGK